MFRCFKAGSSRLTRLHLLNIRHSSVTSANRRADDKIRSSTASRFSLPNWCYWHIALHLFFHQCRWRTRLKDKLLHLHSTHQLLREEGVFCTDSIWHLSRWSFPVFLSCHSDNDIVSLLPPWVVKITCYGDTMLFRGVREGGESHEYI